jgi:TolB-like protein/DNA-binding SARP family transcriptional activator
MLDLRTLGTVDLRSDGASVLSVLSQPARVAILVYLAAARPRGPHRRDVLLNLLWGERDEAAARASLRQTLYRLRQSLGDDLIDGAGEQSVTLNNRAVWCDAVEFERALDERRFADAVELYHGPFLNGFNVPDALEFERWVDDERRRLANRAKEAFWCLSDASAARGAFEEAAAFTRRALEIEPDDERVWRRLIDLLDHQGDRAAALRTYEQLVERMASELEAAPSPETQELIARIRARRFERPLAERERPRVADVPAPTTMASAPNDLGGAEAPPAPVQATSPTHSGPRWTRARAVAGIGLGLVAMTLVALILVSRRAPQRTLGLTLRSAAGLVGSLGGSASARRPASNIAVLPLANVGGRPEQDYFADGLTDELITTLSRVRSLRVVARTSAFAFKGQNRDVREIGRTLGVGTVLEGSVRRDGDRLRVSVELIDATDGFQIWSNTYERRIEDLFDVQTDLALRIADALRAELTPAERERLRRPPTTSLEAYTLYLKGRYFWERRSGGGMDTAIEYFRRAITTDSGFATAYAGLAGAYGPLAVHGFIDPVRARVLMREAARRAVELDPNLAEARTVLAAYYAVFEWEERRAEEEFQRAIALDPGYPTAYFLYGTLLENQGRFAEAVAARSKAYELDPLSPLAATGRGIALSLVGKGNAALADYHTALEMDSTAWITHFELAQVQETRGDIAAALRSIDRAIAYAGATARPRAARARLLVLAGDTARARALVDSLTAQAASTHIWLPSVATALYALGRHDEALDWLERGYRQRHPELPYLRVRPAAARMRADPRFAEFFRRIQPR